MKKALYLILMLMIMATVSGCGNGKSEQESMATDQTTLDETEDDKNNSVEETEDEQTADTIKEEEESTSQEADEETVNQEVDQIVTDKAEIVGMSNEILQNMTLEEKIGQLFIVNFELLDTRKGDSHAFTKVTATMREALKRYNVGGVILFSRNIDTPEQTTKFISKLQDFSKIPLFISVDEEGGEVARIAGNEQMNTTSFPTMQEVGAMGNEEYAYNMGKTIGSEIKALGFNLDFAPVCDVKTNELNTEIGNRSFGDDPKLVADMISQVVKGLQEENVISTLKHFPGQGSTALDSHKGAVDVDSNITELRKGAFVPFKAGIKAGADMVMVSHLSISNVTGSTKPASMTELVLKDILRTELSFEGVIVTDAMNMKSVTDYYTSGQAAVNSIEAGADIILMPENLDAAFNAVLHAVENGKLEEKKIDESVLRILELKIKRGIITADTALTGTQSE